MSTGNAELVLNTTAPDAEKTDLVASSSPSTDIEKQRQHSVAEGIENLDQALQALDIDAKEADEAFAFLKNHPNADSVTQDAVAILNDPKLTKKLLRKIDWVIIPCMMATYFLQFLDKTTVSYTSIMGMRTDTHLHGQGYSNISMMFYVGFLAAEFPTQYFAQRISRLGKYLGANVMLWGVVLSTMAASNSYAALMVQRTLLGIFEACVAPILVLIIAMWYQKREQGRRVSFFYVCNSLTQIIGGLIAYGASFTQSGFASWRIFFLVIGLLTIVLGGFVFTVLPDSPVKAPSSRFSDAEKIAALIRVKDNQSGTQNAKIKMDQVVKSFKDLRVWLVALSVMLTSIPNGGISNFSSILLTTFGYSSREALILNTPSGVFGVFFVLLTGYLSDRWNDRSMAFMLLLAWNASNLAGHSKKVTVNALTLVAFCTGNIVGTQTFQDSEAPGYKSGKISIMSTLCAQILVCVALRVCNERLNRQNRQKVEEMGEEERETLREKLAYADVTDRENPFFVYTR
ncbi:MAG: hypothetical protein Q9227_003864 [Pyrenula ochraceoflavens]